MFNLFNKKPVSYIRYFVLTKFLGRTNSSYLSFSSFKGLIEQKALLEWQNEVRKTSLQNELNNNLMNGTRKQSLNNLKVF